MIDEPYVDRAELAEGIRRGWGRPVATLTFLPIGLDARAFAYEVITEDGGRLFLKVRLGAVNPIAVILPRYLHRIGLREVVAPLDTVDGRPSAPVAGHELLLHPFVEGGSRKDQGLSDQQWVAYGAFVGGLPAVTLPPELAGLMRTETFAPAAVRAWGSGSGPRGRATRYTMSSRTGGPRTSASSSRWPTVPTSWRGWRRPGRCPRWSATPTSI